MIAQIQEILRNKNNLFDFEIIELLISKYGYSVSEKEWYTLNNNKPQFQTWFISLLEENGIRETWEAVYSGNYYSYYHRFNLV